MVHVSEWVMKMRRKDREITSSDKIAEILKNAKILRLGLFDAEYPYIVPMHYAYIYDKGNITLYMHCAKEGHKLDLIKKNPNACVELECGVALIPAGDEACSYGSAYASIIGCGKAEIVRDDEEKAAALKLLMLNQVGREFEITIKMTSAVEVIKVSLSSFTAKGREN